MTTERELMYQGLCTACKVNKTNTGPWTDDKIAAMHADLGTSTEEEGEDDWCDDCFTKLVCNGDGAKAKELLGRQMVFQNAI